jgi:hypothetical protein
VVESNNKRNADSFEEGLCQTIHFSSQILFTKQETIL